MVTSISAIANYAKIETIEPIGAYSLGYSKDLLNEAIDKINLSGDAVTLKKKFDLIRSNITYIQNRIQYDEYRIDDLSSIFDKKIIDIVNELNGKIDSLSTNLNDNYYTKSETSSDNELNDEFIRVYRKIEESSGKTDLSNYYKKSETSSSTELTKEFSKYVLSDDVKELDNRISSIEKDYLTSKDKKELSNKFEEYYPITETSSSK